MDILQIIKTNIDAVPSGPHSKGLKSVLGHIEVAFEHLARGQQQQVDSAFTDAIYRTNQAFEGSIKEAYRVLADKDPGLKTPFEIEKYLQDNKTFRDRVLSQFTTYRKEWRNPSTHDYSLDFDEDEAFLAIMSVSSFLKLLIDQIVEKLTFSAVTEVLQREETVQAVAAELHGPLHRQIANSIINFMTNYRSTPISSFQTEMELMGALSAYLTQAHPEHEVRADVVLNGEARLRADMIVSKDGERVVLELKRIANRSMIDNGLRQLEKYLDFSNATAGLLFTYGGNDVVYGSDNRTIGAVPVTLVAPVNLLNVNSGTA